MTIAELEHIFEVYMSPGSVTERLHFYAERHTTADRTSAGGGLADDGEDIEVLDLNIDHALQMITDGRIADGKTTMLLQWAALSGPCNRAGTPAADEPQAAAAISRRPVP